MHNRQQLAWQQQDLAVLARDLDRVGDGQDLSQAEVEHLAARWRPIARPPAGEEELFDLVDAAGARRGVAAPRWLCHLLGLCHRTVHLALRTPQNLLVLQVRSRYKLDWPGALDLAVTGHVRAGQDWSQAIIDEAAEELGLDVAPGSAALAPPGLAPIGRPDRRRATDSHNPPVHICHVTQLYATMLSPQGLAGLHFADGEVAGLLLCTDAEASRLMAEEPERLAPGLVQSLPRYLNG